MAKLLRGAEHDSQLIVPSYRKPGVVQWAIILIEPDGSRRRLRETFASKEDAQAALCQFTQRPDNDDTMRERSARLG